MENRDQVVVNWRGPALGEVPLNQHSEEAFQNQVLRPILKFQNTLLVQAFKHHLLKHKSDFHTFSPEKKVQYITTVIQKDIKFRNALKGMVIALFTQADYERYMTNSSSLNKRMMQLVIERLCNQIQLFEQQV